MEGITNIEKTKEDIKRCKQIVSRILEEELTEEMLEELTKEVMDTSLFIGGDFSSENIENLALLYKETNAIERFKKAYGGEK